VDLWSVLVPLVIASALVPVQIIITILLLRSASGRFTAVAWVAGMAAVRLVQGVVFGLILSSTDDASSSGPGPIVSAFLLVVGVLLLISAIRQLTTDVDPDAPPPKWLTKAETMAPGKAFLLGIGVMTIGAKFWVFTLTAIGAIGEADLGQPAATLTYLAYVVLAESIHVVIIGFATLAPSRSDAVLTSASTWLSDKNREIMIGIGFVFGAWFVVKALDGLGVF
jgi:hypothetical protein